MDPIKESFFKVKQDIASLQDEIVSLEESVKETRNYMVDICEVIQKLHEKIDLISKKQDLFLSTHNSKTTTTTTHPSTLPHEIEGLKSPNLGFSTGNGGVSTDRQTDRQTHNRHINTPKFQDISVDNAAELLDSLDSIKKEIRLKFKRLTDQEWMIFSTIYQLDEEQGPTDYKSLATKLNLTESSIRDYVGRIIKKGVPVEKNKVNNKNIQISVSQNLKKIASLATIVRLRDL